MIRRYPVGVQDFEKIRKDGYLYVDKTVLIYRLVNEGSYYFINRPRRFGKSLFISTLAAYFEGKRELFDGLAIADLEKDWPSHPVLRFDFSTGKYENAEILREDIDFKLSEYERQYNIEKVSEASNVRMQKLLKEIYRQTGRQIVILIDEYDSAMLYNAANPEMQATVREMMRNLFAPIKEADPMLRFVFFTGITKFSQMSVFSELNNLTNISMLPQYDALLGITQEEIETQMRPDIEMLAQRRGETPEETLRTLKAMYDGYHFSYEMTDIYNPFSLLKCLMTGEVESFWFASATPTFLIRILRELGGELPDIEGVIRNTTAFDTPIDGKIKDPIPVIFQSGYLTIKAAYKMPPYGQYRYMLGFPNQEVRTGFADSLINYVNNDNKESLGAITNAYWDFYDDDDLTAFIEALRTFFASFPYDINNQNEKHYQAVLYTLLVSFGADVRAEHHTNRGRIDIILRMPKSIYVIELKYDHPAREAIDQILSRGYADALKDDPRPVRLVGICFSSKERNITEWKIVNRKS